jgi:hypothetical protein
MKYRFRAFPECAGLSPLPKRPYTHEKGPRLRQDQKKVGEYVFRFSGTIQGRYGYSFVKSDFDTFRGSMGNLLEQYINDEVEHGK